MARHEAYSDQFTGDYDKSIKAILEHGDEEEGQKLRRVLLKVINNELTGRQKEIIMLYYFRGKDMADISARLEVSKQAVYAAMSRARLKIYSILKYYI